MKTASLALLAPLTAAKNLRNQDVLAASVTSTSAHSALNNYLESVSLADICFTQTTATCAFASTFPGHITGQFAGRDRILKDRKYTCLAEFKRQMMAGEVAPSKLPALKVFFDSTNGRLVSLDNRRLAVMKQACTEKEELSFCQDKGSVKLAWATKAEVFCMANYIEGNIKKEKYTADIVCDEKTPGGVGDGNHWQAAAEGQIQGKTITLKPTNLAGWDFTKPPFRCPANVAWPTSTQYQCGAVAEPKSEVSALAKAVKKPGQNSPAESTSGSGGVTVAALARFQRQYWGLKE